MAGMCLEHPYMHKFGDEVSKSDAATCIMQKSKLMAKAFRKPGYSNVSQSSRAPRSYPFVQRTVDNKNDHRHSRDKEAAAFELVAAYRATAKPAITTAAAANEPRPTLDAAPVKVAIGADPVPVALTRPVPEAFGVTAPVAKPVGPPPTALNIKSQLVFDANATVQENCKTADISNLWMSSVPAISSLTVA